jgi:hypothetical protein
MLPPCRRPSSRSTMPAGRNGSIANGTHVLCDINGYFAP